MSQPSILHPLGKGFEKYIAINLNSYFSVLPFFLVHRHFGTAVSQELLEIVIDCL